MNREPEFVLGVNDEEGVELAWAAEIERRVTELDSGAVQSIPWDQLRTRLDNAI